MYNLLVMKKGHKTNKIYRMTPELEKRLERVEEDIKHKRNFSPKFKSMDAAISYLKKQW